MDLIYTDSQKKDIGVLKDYTMDLAYGSDENNFELVVPLSKDNIIEYDSIVYMDGTEYGGFIDERVVSTTSSNITYKGRTPHGFLNSYVIYPNGPDGYRTVTGDALNILIDILAGFNLLDYFEFDTEAESIYIGSFKFRYEYIYDGMIKMLSTVNAKLILIWHNGKIRVTIKTISNYADEQELDSSQLLFTIGNKENCVNHLLCLGQGELNDRKVISLYTNENGFIQPYLVNDPPYEDSDYVLDNTYQLLSGKDEICQIYDYPSASPVEKYKELTEMPDNWFDTYEQYYKLENGSYTQNETVYEDYYQQLTSQPADWASNYSDYYTLKETSPGVWEYVNISSDLIDQYALLNTEPPGLQRMLVILNLMEIIIFQQLGLQLQIIRRKSLIDLMTGKITIQVIIINSMTVLRFCINQLRVYLKIDMSGRRISRVTGIQTGIHTMFLRCTVNISS